VKSPSGGILESVMDDFDLLADEAEEQTEGQQRILSCPNTLSSSEIEDAYRGRSHQSFHEAVMVFEDENGEIEYMIGVGIIQNHDAAILLLTEKG
jgi:hypothetical protein